jgi:hypothetical protein
MFGVIELGSTQYMLLIEECTLVGQILRANILRVDKILFVPLTLQGKMDV